MNFIVPTSFFSQLYRVDQESQHELVRGFHFIEIYDHIIGNILKV